MKGKKENKNLPFLKNNLPNKQSGITSERWIYYALAFIILISFAAYLPVFNNSLLSWDDATYIKNNLLIRSFNLKEIFSTFVIGNYHPFTMLILAVEYHLFGLNAAGYHGVNLLLHLVIVILVFYSIYYLIDKVAVALIASLLFGIHPLHVESVAWAAELKDLLYTLFFLASYICYLKYLKGKLRIEDHRKLITNRKSATANYEDQHIGTSTHQHISTSTHQHIGTSTHQHISTSTHQHISTSTHQHISKSNYYIFALLLFLISLLSKAMAVSLPVILILTDYFKGRKINKMVLLEKGPFFLLAIIFGIIAILAQKSSNSILQPAVIPFAERIIFASYGFMNYLLKLLFPLNLCAYYPYPVKNGAVYIPNHYYLYLFAFIVLAVCIIYSRRFSRNIIFGMGFFTFTILLVLQLLPVGRTMMADRYGYIPSIGIFYLAGEAVMLSWSNKLKWGAIALISVAAVLFSVKTYTRCGVWKNDEIFWTDVIARYPNVDEAYYNRGLFYQSKNRRAEADKDFNKAFDLNNRGLAFMNIKRNDKNSDINKDPLIYFNKAIEANPGDAQAFYNRGEYYLSLKRYNDAIKDFDNAIELKTDYFQAYLNRGIILAMNKRFEEAIRDMSKAIEIKPNYALAWYNRGVFEYQSGNKTAACNDLKRAAGLKYKPAAEALSRICK